MERFESKGNEYAAIKNETRKAARMFNTKKIMFKGKTRKENFLQNLRSVL